MSRNEIILGAVALVLVAFSLVVSLVVPRRRPDFPGNRLGLFTVVCVLLVVAMLAAVEVFGAEEGHGEAGEVVEVQDAGEPDAESPTTTGAETETGGEEGEAGSAEGGADAAAGEEVFASAGCANCHTLAAAGATGTIGPNLDETSPSEEAAVEQITNGGNGMPAYGDQLSEDEIRAVAAFVTQGGR